MKRKSAVDANRVFFSSVILSQVLVSLIAASGVTDRMVLQFLIQIFIASPAVAYLLLSGSSIKNGIGRLSVGLGECLLLIPFAFCAGKIAEFLNGVSLLFSVNTVGQNMAERMLNHSFSVAFLVIAVMPALCEEVVFRGVLYRNYRKSGVCVALILTAVLFGLMHMNLNQLLYAVVLGFLFAAVNEITGSVLPSVGLHLYINGRSVVQLYGEVNYLKGLREQYVATETVGDMEGMERISSLADGVPIERGDWLQEYMTSTPETVKEQVIQLLPWFLAAVAGTVVIVGLLLWCRKRRGTEQERSLFGDGKEPAEKSGWRNVLSPTLFFGVLYCVAEMIGRLLM